MNNLDLLIIMYNFLFYISMSWIYHDDFHLRSMEIEYLFLTISQFSWDTNRVINSPPTLIGVGH